MADKPPLGMLPVNRSQLAYYVLRLMDQSAHLATALAAVQAGDAERFQAESEKLLELQKKLMAEVIKFVGGIGHEQ